MAKTPTLLLMSFSAFMSASITYQVVKPDVTLLSEPIIIERPEVKPSREYIYASCKHYIQSKIEAPDEHGRIYSLFEVGNIQGYALSIKDIYCNVTGRKIEINNDLRTQLHSIEEHTFRLSEPKRLNLSNISKSEYLDKRRQVFGAKNES